MKPVIIIGGGLAGLTAAIHLANEGIEVVVIDKKNFPQHKLCGEYLSHEVMPYFKSLNIDLSLLSPNKIQRFLLSSPSGKTIETQLPLGGIGVSRYALDAFLYEEAKERGVIFHLNTTVKTVTYSEDSFEVKCKKGAIYKSKVVIGGYGRRTGLDKQLHRKFATQTGGYIGVKYYFEAPHYPDDLVVLHNFEGGYCGAAKVENGWVNATYLATHQQLKEAGKLQHLEEHVLFKNTLIKDLFRNSKQVLPKPITVSNINFIKKELVQNHIMMVGDAAGMIAPVCGNGMAMGIHAAKMASEETIDFLKGKQTRQIMEEGFQRQWNKAFGSRMFWGGHFHKFMGQPMLSEFAVRSLKIMPILMPMIIRQTHGEVF